MSCCSTILCNTDKQTKEKNQSSNIYLQNIFTPLNIRPEKHIKLLCSMAFELWPQIFPVFYFSPIPQLCILFEQAPGHLNFSTEINIDFRCVCTKRSEPDKRTWNLKQNSRGEKKNIGIYQLHTVCMWETENRRISYLQCALEKQISSITFYGMHLKKTNLMTACL